MQLQEVERRHALPRQRAPRETALCERALQADSSLCGSLFSSGRAQSSRCHTRPCPGSTGRCQGNRSWGSPSTSCRCPQGRVLARHRHARGVGYADDSYFYAQLKAALKVLDTIPLGHCLHVICLNLGFLLFLLVKAPGGHSLHFRSPVSQLGTSTSISLPSL